MRGGRMASEKNAARLCRAGVASLGSPVGESAAAATGAVVRAGARGARGAAAAAAATCRRRAAAGPGAAPACGGAGTAAS